MITMAVATSLAIILFILRGTSAPVYTTKVRPIIRDAVLNNDLNADATLETVTDSASPSARAQIEKDVISCTIAGLNSGGDRLWKPYNYVRAKAPICVSRHMPLWPEPRKVRRATAWWLLYRALPEDPKPAALGLNELAAPVLCRLARSDKDPAVRQAATWALGAIGTPSPEALQIMLAALNHTEPEDRRAATRWFGRNKLAADKIVPVLVRGLEDNAMRSDYAQALRAYGPLAKVAVEPLTALSRTNDRATASVAYWALSGIDPQAAARVGAR